MKDMTIALVQEDAKTLTEALGIAGERHDAILSALHDHIKAILDQAIRGADKDGTSVNVATSLASLSRVCIHQMASVSPEIFLEKMG